MKFEYLERVVVEASLEIEDIGNCCILCRNDIGEEFYLLTKTVMGWTEIIEYGPCTPDLDILPFNVQLLYDRFEWNQYKLEKRIDKFLNNPKRAITQAEESTLDVVLPCIKSPTDIIFKDYSKPLFNPYLDDQNDEDDIEE